MEPELTGGGLGEGRPLGGYGRIWESLYKGSMVGAGIEAFAVWPYVISNMRPHGDYGAVVQLNPKLLGLIFGCEEKLVSKGIEKLCAPDLASHRKEEGGRRLVKISGYFYRVVNGSYYMGLRKKETDRIKHAESQRVYRTNKRESGRRKAEREVEDLERRGDTKGALRAAELRDEVEPGQYGSGAAPQGGVGEEPPLEERREEDGQFLTPEPEL
jgi:hypothetical protein